MNLPYPDMDFTPFDTLPAADLDKLVANIESLAEGSGFEAGAIGAEVLMLRDMIPCGFSHAGYSAVATGTNVMPSDDTMPQNTEGDQYMTLSHTPKASTNILLIEVNAMLASSAIGLLPGALFKDSDTSALAADEITAFLTGAPSNMVFRHYMVAGTTSAIAFKFRAGVASASTMTFNGIAGGRLFSTLPKSSITVTEFKKA